jgi:hypothetical protein
MMQPETLLSLLDRLNQFNLQESQFRDIQIKSAELIKQLFPLDNAATVYQINTLYTFNYQAVSTLKSILEAKLQTLIRDENNRQKNEENFKAKLKTVEAEKNNQIQELNVSNRRVFEDKMQVVNTELKKANELNANYSTIISELQAKVGRKNSIKLIENGIFWTIVISVCALFLFAGYYWGNNKFDSEKFQLKDQRDYFKHLADSLKKAPAKKSN